MVDHTKVEYDTESHNFTFSVKPDKDSVSEQAFQFRFKIRYLWNWKECYSQWVFSREMNEIFDEMANELRDELDINVVQKGNKNARND